MLGAFLQEISLHALFPKPQEPSPNPTNEAGFPKHKKTKRSLSLLKRLISSALSSEPTMHLG